MKLLIDTVNTDFYMAIIEDNKTLAFSHLEKLVKKTDALPEEFEKLINKLGIKAKEIKEIYIVNGPGSFMGIRAGMTFGKTMALITKAKLFGIVNPLFISGGKDGSYFIDAKGSKSYVGKVESGKCEISIENFQEDSTINYDELKSTPSKYLALFTEVKDILEYKANYVKDPQIGGL